MASSLLDLARPSQVNKSLAQQSALTSTASARPKTRFDDVLAQRRSAEPQKSTAEQPEPTVKADKPRKNEAAKSKTDDKPVDQARPTEEPTDETTPTDEAAADETEASQSTAKPKKTKPTKDVEKANENTSATADDAAADVDSVDGQTPTVPVSELPPAEGPVEDVGEIEQGEKKPIVEKQPADADTAVDPTFITGQLNTLQPQPTEQQPAEINGQTSDDATAELAGVTSGTTKAQTEAAKVQTAAKPAEATEAGAKVDLKPHAEKGLHAADDELLANADEAAGAIVLPSELTQIDSKAAAEVKPDPSAALQAATAPHEKSPASHANAMPAVPQSEAPVPQRSVAEENVDRIVTSIHGDIATKGGTMQIRLDPPSLGAINVQISIDDGVMSASLQTNNEEATRLLSHNLAQLKSQLESAGVTVDRIQVKQGTPTEQSSNSNNQSEGGDRQQNRDAGQDQSARQEQQRREMLQRMWAKLAGNGDPLDLVA